jgi:hypothetical protein
MLSLPQPTPALDQPAARTAEIAGVLQSPRLTHRNNPTDSYFSQGVFLTINS